MLALPINVNLETSSFLVVQVILQRVLKDYVANVVNGARQGRSDKQLHNHVHHLRVSSTNGLPQDWVRQFLKDFFPSAGPAPCAVCPPRWVKDALEVCGIPLDDLFERLDLLLDSLFPFCTPKVPKAQAILSGGS